MTCIETEPDLQLSFLTSSVKTSEEMMRLLTNISINETAPTLDNLFSCKILVERPFEKYNFITKIPTLVKEKPALTLLQSYPELYEKIARNTTMSLLLEALKNNLKISVAIRDPNCKKESSSLIKVIGNLSYFDKHFNLVLSSSFLCNLFLGIGELYRKRN